MFTYLFRFILFIVLLTTSSCKWEGTDTGNPQATPAPTHGSEKSFGEVLGETVCAVVAACYGQELAESCQSNVMDVDGFAPALGYDAPYSTLSDLQNSDLEYDKSMAEICVDGLDQLTCDHASVNESYDPSHPNDFSELYKLLLAVDNCAKVAE